MPDSILSPDPASVSHERAIAGRDRPGATPNAEAPSNASPFRNVRLMRLLERLARRFNEAGVPVMVLKGAALNLTLYDRPAARPMADLDLMIHSADLARARQAIELCGGLRAVSHAREDFFPRFHYETEYTVGTIYPTKIDLHVRPFRPMRYAQTVPESAFWEGARPVRAGSATVLHPAATDMLLHLLVHSAVHGNNRYRWLQDVALWVQKYEGVIDWDDFMAKAVRWRLILPACAAMVAVEQVFGPIFPQHAFRRFADARVGWADRLALWQAPRDAEHPAAHVLVNLLSTTGLRHRAKYLGAVLFPDRTYLADSYVGRHVGWLATAHVLRWIRPIAGKTRLGRRIAARVEIRPSAIHGVGVFAAQRYRPGEVIVRCQGVPVSPGRQGAYIVQFRDQRGTETCLELTGKLKHLNHSCSPNGIMEGLSLVALQPLSPGDEITIDYGPHACDCRTQNRPPVAASGRELLAKAC